MPCVSPRGIEDSLSLGPHYSARGRVVRIRATRRHAFRHCCCCADIFPGMSLVRARGEVGGEMGGDVGLGGGTDEGTRNREFIFTFW